MITIDGGTGIILNNGVEVASPKMMDAWHLNANWTTSDVFITGTVFTRISSTFNGGASQIGSGMTYPSGDGTFSFPSTGKYLIYVNGIVRPTTGDNMYMYLHTTTDNSTYVTSMKLQANNSSDGGTSKSASNMYFFDVTNTSTHKVKLYVSSIASGSYWEGTPSSDTSSGTMTNIMFQKVGET